MAPVSLLHAGRARAWRGREPLRILVVADVEDALLHEHYRPERWVGENHIDLLISCGDLPSAYLDFLISSSSSQ